MGKTKKRRGGKSASRKIKEAAYWSSGRNETNKERRKKKHQKKHPKDVTKHINPQLKNEQDKIA